MFISEYHFIFLLTKKDFNWHVKCMHEVLYDVTCIPTLHNVQPGYKSLSIPTFLHSENIQNHFFWTFYKREIYSIISLALAPYLSIKCKSLLLTPTYYPLTKLSPSPTLLPVLQHLVTITTLLTDMRSAIFHSTYEWEYVIFVFLGLVYFIQHNNCSIHT